MNDGFCDSVPGSFVVMFALSFGKTLGIRNKTLDGNYQNVVMTCKQKSIT